MRVRTIGTSPTRLLWCALALALVMSAAAADTSGSIRTEETWVQSAPTIAEPQRVRLALAMEGEPSPASITEPRNISLDFHAADITDVLKALAVQSGANIVTGTDVKGQVTVSLNHVSLQEALDMVTKLSGYKYATVGVDTYIVGSSQNLSAVLGSGAGPAETVVEAVALHHASPEDMVKALSEQIPSVKASAGNTSGGGSGQTAGPKQPGVVLLNGAPRDVAAARDIIAKVEESIQRGGPDTVTRVYRIKYSDSAELGKLIGEVAPAVSVVYGPTTNFQLKQPEVLKGGFGAGPGGSGGSGSSGGAGEQYEFKIQPETLVLSGPADDVDRVMDLLKDVDTRPTQILIEAKIMDLTNEAAKDVGLDWSWSTLSTTSQVNVDNTRAETLAAGASAMELETSRIVTRALQIGPAQLLTKLSLLATAGKAKLLANPKVAAVTGKPANIFIGDEIKYVISIQNTVTGQNIETETAMVGIQLRTIGVVGPEDEITLNIHPEVSVISSFLELDNGIALPQIARRFTDSTIRVKSGDTIAIGGLIREQEITSMSKVPFLGDLPILGQLFQRKSKSKEHSEITVFITATVLKE